MDKPIISIRMGELQAVRAGTARLICYGLGSCVGVALRDPTTGVAAMAHVVLPDSSIRSPGRSEGRDSPAKFANEAIPAAIEAMVKLGASRQHIRAWLAGGAHVLKGMTFLRERVDIGGRNVEAVRAALAAQQIPIVGEDVGGEQGRTMELDSETGEVRILMIGRGEKRL